MSGSSDTDLDAIKRSVDLVALAERYGARLAKRGREWWGPCPFHAERTPSFHVRPEHQTFHCFGCGEGGDVIAFVMRAEGCDFAEAVRRLGGDLNGLTPVRLPPPLSPEPPRPRAWQHDPERWVRRFCAAPDRVSAWQAYRPLTEETITRWDLGIGILPSTACPHRRLIVPVREGGRAVGLAGRSVACPPADTCPKWLVAAGSKFALFNLDAVTPGCTVIVVENRADAILACQEWPDYVTVAKGSANVWRPEWTERLLAVGPEFVLFWPDNDPAGYAGAARGANEVNDAAGKAGIAMRARVRQWSDAAPAKADLGWFLSRSLERRSAA